MQNAKKDDLKLCVRMGLVADANSGMVFPPELGMPERTTSDIIATRAAGARFLFSGEDVHRILAHDSLVRREPQTVEIHSPEQVLTFAQQDGGKSQVHLVNPFRNETLAN